MESEFDADVDADCCHFQELIAALKEKFNRDETDRAHKLQILTLLPANWSVKKISQTMNTTLYMAKKSKKLFESKGILSLPDKKHGVH